MTRISITELNANIDKYIVMAQDQDIFITKNGKPIAKLVAAKVDKVTASKSMFGILYSDVDLDEARENRLK